MSYTTFNADTQALRLKQIESLRQYCTDVREIVRHQLYEVPVPIHSKPTLYVIVQLRPDFPQSAPHLALSLSSLTTNQGTNASELSHRAINKADGTIKPESHPKLQTWTLHNNLGKLVAELVQFFQQDPPHIGAAPSFNAVPKPNSQANSVYGMGTVPEQFNELRALSLEQLTALLNDEQQCDALFDSLESVKTLNEVRRQMETRNQELISKNVELQSQVQQYKVEFEECKRTVEQLREEFNLKARRQQEAMKKYATDTIIKSLAQGCEEIDAQSTQLAAQLKDSAHTPSEFVSQYMALRTLYHLRAAKRESLMQFTSSVQLSTTPFSVVRK
jgi:DNA repair exonuclease SbcCD ATPase subunit